MNHSGKTKSQKDGKARFQRQKAMRQGRHAPEVSIAHLLLSVKFMFLSEIRSESVLQPHTGTLL